MYKKLVGFELGQVLKEQTSSKVQLNIFCAKWLNTPFYTSCYVLCFDNSKITLLIAESDYVTICHFLGAHTVNLFAIIYEGVPSIAQWISVQKTSCYPWVRVPSFPSTLLSIAVNFVLYSSCEKNEN